MANLSREDVLKLARLSRLQLDDDEVTQFQAEIAEILKYVEKLQTVTLEGLLPTDQVTGLKNVTRPDVVKDYGVTPQELMKNVPMSEDGQIKVRKML